MAVLEPLKIVITNFVSESVSSKVDEVPIFYIILIVAHYFGSTKYSPRSQ